MGQMPLRSIQGKQLLLI